MSKITVSHTIEFQTDFILENMEEGKAALISDLPPEMLQSLCNQALKALLRDKVLERVNSQASWGILRLAGEE